MLAQRILERNNYKVVTAENGIKFLAIYEQMHIDLVLMDINMPEMDGLTATIEVRRREQISGKHTPIIALTASVIPEDEETCLEAGMDAFLMKPIDSRLLLRAVSDVLRRYPPAEQKKNQLFALAKTRDPSLPH